MRKIPEKLKKEIEESGQNDGCVLDTGEHGPCEGGIEWHHCFLYAGKQINEKWAILGACQRHHKLAHGNKEVKNAFRRESLKRAAPEDLEKYPRESWEQLKKYLKGEEEPEEEIPF